MKRALAAEAVGTALLVATVIGSGIMAEQLAAGNQAVALLGNSIATGAMLYVLITLFGPISGAQFNPLVTLLLAEDNRAARIAAQVAAALAGTLIAHGMFDHVPLEPGIKARGGAGQWLGEAVATFGLLLTIHCGAHFRPTALPALVAGWIVAGYWFTSSTSFANPAVTLARAFTDSFAGIRLIDVPAFLIAQAIGALAGHHLGRWLCAAGDYATPILEPKGQAGP
jgi:glycerol uptake facilitator-like aquaporin